MTPSTFTSLPTRARIGLTFGLLVLAAFSIIGWASARWLEPHVTELHAKRIHDSAVRMATALDVGIFERLRELSHLAAAVDGLPDAAFQRDLDRLKATSPDYAWIAVTDTQGVVVAATGGELQSMDVSRQPWWRQAMSGSPSVGQVHDAVLLKRLAVNDDSGPLRVIDLSTPLRSDGRVTGVLVAALSWQWIAELHNRLAATTAPEDAIELFAFDPDGADLHFSPAAPQARPMAVDLGSLANDGASIVRWSDGKRYLTAVVQRTGFQQHPGLGWTVVVRQPLELATATANSLRASIWGLGALGALCLAALGWWAAGWVLRPLRVVAEAAQAQSHITPQGGNEVHQLAWALGDLVTRLRTREHELVQLTSTLERRVASRTAELERRNSDLRGMARMVSHDVRAPIGSIMQVLQLAIEAEPERRQQLLHMVMRECARVGEVVDALLTLSVSESQPLQTATVDMAVAAAAAAERQRAALHYLGTMDIGALPLVQGDPVLLGQVWDNLIGNAMKFSRYAETPRVTVSADHDNDNWVFRVDDNGVGFDDTQADRLFTAFERLHRDGRYPGTGLGLSIVRRIVERHGGEVRARSRAGQGASFSFTLPLSA